MEVPVATVALPLRQQVCSASGMLFALLVAIALCVCVAWLLLHVGADVLQALAAVAMMTLAWYLLRRRPRMTIADDFRNW